jgi:GT2 family glycosyltransferase
MLFGLVIWPYSAYRTARWSLDQPQKVDTLLGACLLLRRTALDQIGLLDENYFIFSEEVDLCYRLQKANWHIYWLAKGKLAYLLAAAGTDYTLRRTEYHTDRRRDVCASL